MDKKSEGRNWDKGAGHEGGHDRPDHERGSDKHQDREKGGGGSQQGSGDFRPNADAQGQQGSGASDYGQMADSKRNQDMEKSDYHYNQAAEKAAADQLAADTKKSGCLPKIGMLLLPFVALATYVALRS